MRLNADAMTKCQNVCDGMIDQLDLALERARDLTDISGFGDFPSAVELHAGFQAKGTVGDASVVERLKQYRSVVVHMRDTFSNAGTEYAAADSELRRAMDAVIGERP